MIDNTTLTLTDPPYSVDFTTLPVSLADAVEAASCRALVETQAYLIVVAGELWPRMVCVSNSVRPDDTNADAKKCRQS